MNIPVNEHEEPVCIKCKETPVFFIPVCDAHSKSPCQREIMECEDCATCDECLPRTYWDELSMNYWSGEEEALDQHLNRCRCCGKDLDDYCQKCK